MGFYSWIIKLRFYLGVIVLVAGGVVNIYASIGVAWVLYLASILLIVAHFLFGPLRLVKDKLESGNMDGAEKIIKSVWFPRLLLKPVRSIYYTIQGNIAAGRKDFDTAERLMKKGISTGIPMKEAEGASFLQMSMLASQKGNIKEAERYVRQALQNGLPDKESKAAAYLQMASVMLNRRAFKAAKDFYRKAKMLKPTTPDIVSQMKELEKYISRIPG